MLQSLDPIAKKVINRRYDIIWTFELSFVHVYLLNPSVFLCLMKVKEHSLPYYLPTLGWWSTDRLMFFLREFGPREMQIGLSKFWTLVADSVPSDDKHSSTHTHTHTRTRIYIYIYIYIYGADAKYGIIFKALFLVRLV